MPCRCSTSWAMAPRQVFSSYTNRFKWDSPAQVSNLWYVAHCCDNQFCAINCARLIYKRLMINREDEWIQILHKNIRSFTGKAWSVRGINSCKLKKLQITHKIDGSLQHENPRKSILTSIEFIQQNSLKKILKQVKISLVICFYFHHLRLI